MTRIMPVLAVLAVLAGALVACAEPPSLLGRYSSELTHETLHKEFPDTAAPPGTWNLEFTEFDKVVVDAPDGGGFSLTIKTLEDDEVTFEATGCPAADGSEAGDPVYAIDREDDAIRFMKVRDECEEKNPEAALLTVGTWKRVGARGGQDGEAAGY
jgi:hypothetical protein